MMHTKQDTEKNASRMLLYLICEGGSAKADHHTTKHREPKEETFFYRMLRENNTAKEKMYLRKEGQSKCQHLPAKTRPYST
jgi:hypothetical protein